MRIRPLLALSAVALAGVLLAGCSDSSTPTTSPTPSSTPAADLCDSAAPSGAASESVKVEGDIGKAPTATFTTPLTFDSIERTVVTKGGTPLKAGDFVQYAFTVFDASTGKTLASAGYTPGEALPQQVSPAGGGQLFGCDGPGSRIVFTAPPAQGGPAVVYVLDVLGVTPLKAWGADKPAVEGMPTVTLAADGQPSVKVPDAAAPTELKTAVLKEGDGIEVGKGDTTLLQYYGVDWETGDSFDSSWKRGTPYSADGNSYVAGFVTALEGQKVGSQVLVVIPPALGYGEKSDSNTNELAGKTLVFVIDILATQHAAPAAQ